MTTQTKYPFSIHMGSIKEAGLVARAQTLAQAKRFARSESNALITGEPTSVFNEAGKMVALFKRGLPVRLARKEG